MTMIGLKWYSPKHLLIVEKDGFSHMICRAQLITKPIKSAYPRFYVMSTCITVQALYVEKGATPPFFSDPFSPFLFRVFLSLLNTFLPTLLDRGTTHTHTHEHDSIFAPSQVRRAIPSAVDGLKPSQRKALFACFKRKLTKEIKVAQLVGYVSEHTAYHHGEQSMEQTVVKLAQNFVGSNNINLLFPGGQFGSRLMGGKDAASSRYIFTRLAEITRTIFPVLDDPVLEYLDDEGTSIEPKYYIPIIPLVLVNGCDGIGTGWST